MKLSRRMFLGTGAAALGARALPVAVPKGRVILELVRDRATGALRAVERVVFR